MELQLIQLLFNKKAETTNNNYIISIQLAVIFKKKLSNSNLHLTYSKEFLNFPVTTDKLSWRLASIGNNDKDTGACQENLLNS